MTYLFLFISTLSLYISTLSNTVYGGDAGDLISAILTKGFPHPPGYPLYTIIGRLFILMPDFFLTTAGKVTLISTLSTVFSLMLIYLILNTLIGKKINKPIAIVAVLALFVNYLIWLYAIVPEVFPLNVLITLGIFLAGLQYKNTGKLKWLTLTLFLIGLGISHHHTFIFILPPVFILTYNRIKKIQFSIKDFVLLIASLLIGLLPLVYLPLAFKVQPKIVWGEPNTIEGFINLLSRQAYGSFVPGPFTTNSPLHRFIQLINLNYFVFADFTLVGYLAIIIGFIILIKSKIIDKKEKLAVFLALILYGPFFVFYANFPLRDKFDLATVERFLIVFYFLLSIPLYFGLNWFFIRIISLFKLILEEKHKLFLPAIIILFFLFPIGLGVKNYRRLISLKNNIIAEKIGKDILNNAETNSIIILNGDTALFNTQYVYYSDKKNYPNKIVIQSSKITAVYYQKILKFNYPKLIFSKIKDYTPGRFIEDNSKNYDIYSNNKYILPQTFPYKWVFQGMLFKLVPKDFDNNYNVEKNLEYFWKNAENKDLARYYLLNKNRWFNYFPNDILRVYATAHQNTAFYYLDINKPESARPHINDALILNPDDLDSLFLQSIYYVKLKNCSEAERSIIKALDKNKDSLYLYQLGQLINCYIKDSDKTRIDKLIKKYSQTSNKLLTE